jgi:tetratricopeptide (TPR) repeat protein
MAHAVDSRANNPANQLRELLDDAEKLAVKPQSDTVETLLVLLDQIESELHALAQNGGDLRPEQVRWENLLRRLDSNPKLITRPAAQAGGLDRLRAAHPPAAGFWWRADELESARARRSIRRAATTAAIVIAAILIIPWLINRIFPPDPVAVAVLNATSSAERLAETEDWSTATAVIDQALTELPQSPELLIWGVALAERMADAQKAATLTARAQELFTDDPARFYVMLGMTRLRVRDLEGAMAAGEQAAAINPEDPQAYFIMGNAASEAGDIAAALDFYEKTFTLAEEDNPELAVNARVLWGTLIQQGSMQFSPEATPTPQQ